MIWATVSPGSCFCWLYTASPSSPTKNAINLILVWTIWQEKNDKPRQRRYSEKQRRYSANKDLHSKGYGLPRGHVWLSEPDRKEGRTPKNWCPWTVVLEKTPESPLDCKEIKAVNLKGWILTKPWILTKRTDAEAETPILWPPHAKSWLIGKDSDAGKDWGQKKRVSEDEMVGWHHWCNEHELGQTPGDGDGQGRLVYCSPWGRKELDMTEWLNSNNL